MSRRAGVTNGGQAETTVQAKGNSQEKQAMLLAQDAGHFSLIRYTSSTHIVSVQH